MRGYTVEGVMGLRDGYYKNYEFLQEYFRERGIDFWSFPSPHQKAGLSMEEDTEKLLQWYDSIEGGSLGEGDCMSEVARRLEEKHEARISELESMPARTQKSIWWPFTQHGMVSLEWTSNLLPPTDK
jgi:dethiobiotin synthetase/adenosylmethionine--8-amino-7-oxononanoate aminotransferase